MPIEEKKKVTLVVKVVEAHGQMESCLSPQMTRLSSQPFLLCLRAEMDPQVLGNPSGLLHSGHQLIFF